MSELHPKVEQAELLRRFAIQDAPCLMLFLGAGSSASAGIPTAGDMVWTFKREIYCSETGTNKEAFRDLSIEKNKKQIQQHFDGKSGYPSLWSEHEYSFYFESCYANAADRRSFIRRTIQLGRPTIGHECLAVLLAQGRCDWVWTTNFDDLVERAERPDAPRRLLHIGPESQTRLITALAENLRPIIVKLHGDYRYDRLQNTTGELRSLDNEVRKHLLQTCQENGLIVIGYGGRDESVMSTLEEAAQKGGFKRGLYWCVREDAIPPPRVQALVERAVQKAGCGGIVAIDSFDDFLFRLYRQSGLKDDGIDNKAEALFEQRRPFALRCDRKHRDPLKTNAVRIVEYPSTVSRFPTSIRTWQELRELISDQPIVAGLLKGHLLALGETELIKTTFGDKIKGPIERSNVTYADLTRSNSVILGLFHEMVGRSLLGDYGLLADRRRTFYIADPLLQEKGRTFTFEHRGQEYTIPMAADSQGVVINEAFTYQIEFHEGTVWFILDPCVAITIDGKKLAPVEKRKAIANQTMSSRYNAVAHLRLLFWIRYLSSFSDPITFAFSSKTSQACRFVLDQHYAFSSVE